MTIGIIPARLGSTRLPGKCLADVGGRPLLHWVVENARKAATLDRIIVAGDDERILDAARTCGVEAILTDPSHPSGTDRIAEAARGLDDDIVVNIQGDEPDVPLEAIDGAVRMLREDPDLDMATAAAPIRTREEFLSRDRVKVVLASNGHALYFSRAPIPYARLEEEPDPSVVPPQIVGVTALGHLGIYAYRREVLLALVELEPSPLERCEKLEQLRALQAGRSIGVVQVAEAPPGIDTPADLEAFRARASGRTPGD